MKLSLLGAVMAAGLLMSGNAWAQLKVDLAVIEYGGVLPDVVKKGDPLVKGIDLEKAANAERVASGPLKGGKVIFTQSLAVHPGETVNQSIRIWNQRVKWTGRFNQPQAGVVAAEVKLDVEVGTEAFLRSFIRRSYSGSVHAPLGQMVIADNQQEVSTQKRVTKSNGPESTTKHQAYLLLIQVK